MLDQGKNLVWTEKFEKQEMRQTKVLSCLTVTRISSTLVFCFLFCGQGLFSHIVSTLFPIFSAPVSVRKSHTPVSSSLASARHSPLAAVYTQSGALEALCPGV